ncbi:hypothetical protein HMN09_00806600 [Mycena chlorophos]|uniref:F-box domain-containing protein n=1 Tax=Mycena chlorophos TaxID=658473 RepID=A0A8H6W5E7_MYCCL|nr:hypothetical protein HMN09_00806600 [Mycena chlorophos]
MSATLEVSSFATRNTDRSEVQRLRDQRREIRTTIRKLRDELEDISDLLEEGSKFPVNSLPTELIRMVFMRYIPVYPAGAPLRRGGNCPSTLLASMACHVLGRPTLMTLWLQRSGDLPVSIQADNEMGFDQALLDVILAQRERVEYLRLNATLDEDEPPVWRPGPMPLLRSIELNVGTRLDGDPFVSSTDAPLLRAITIWEYEPTRITFSPDLFPWAHIAALVLLFPPIEPCWATLQCTPNLRYLELCSPFCDRPQPGQLLLPKLDTLVFCCFDLCAADDEDFTPVHLINNLVLPRLRVLRAADVLLRFSDPPSSSIQTITSLIDRSGCKLEEVCIIGDGRSRKDSRYVELLTANGVERVWFEGKKHRWYEEDREESRERALECIGRIV